MKILLYVYMHRVFLCVQMSMDLVPIPMTVDVVQLHAMHQLVAYIVIQLKVNVVEIV